MTDATIPGEVFELRNSLARLQDRLNLEHDHQHDLRTRNRDLWAALDDATRALERIGSSTLDPGSATYARHIAARLHRKLNDQRRSQR